MLDRTATRYANNSTKSKERTLFQAMKLVPWPTDIVLKTPFSDLCYCLYLVAVLSNIRGPGIYGGHTAGPGTGISLTMELLHFSAPRFEPINESAALPAT